MNVNNGGTVEATLSYYSGLVNVRSGGRVVIEESSGIGTWEAGSVFVYTGGVLEAEPGAVLTLGQSVNSQCTLVVDGGTVTSAADIELGALDEMGEARVTVRNGGLLDAYVLRVGTGFPGVVDLQDGAIRVNTLHLGDSSSSVADDHLTVTDGGSLVVDGGLVLNWGGSMTLTDGTVTAAEIRGSGPSRDLVLAGGTLRLGASRRTSGTMNDATRLEPGLNEEVAAMSGSYEQGPDATMAIDVMSGNGGAPVAGRDFDQLTATWIRLAGTLEVTLDPSYVPVVGDRFAIVSGDVIYETFDTVIVPTLPGKLTMNVEYHRDRVELVVVRSLMTANPK